jgi:3-hydroxypropanoate dehydrogenase
MNNLSPRLSGDAIKRLFEEPRTHSAWLDAPVPEELIRNAYELARLGPTSANSNPMRLIILRSGDAKERLLPALSSSNVEKTRSAPLVLLIAHDLAFLDKLPDLFPHANARSWFAGNDDLIQETTFRNGSLQAAYLIVALRALGLDVGPMSGFDARKVNREFFADTTWRVNFILNVGYGRADALRSRLPRLDFADIAIWL